MSDRDIQVDAAYLRGIIQQELKAALEGLASARGCDIQSLLNQMNLIAKANKGDLGED